MQNEPKPQPGLIVEDATQIGGKDEKGADVIRPKQVDGKVEESVKATDPRESRKHPYDKHGG